MPQYFKHENGSNIPSGVINIVTGDGRVGSALASHMGINKISFTGSSFAGKKVQEMAAKRYVEVACKISIHPTHLFAAT